MLNIDIQWAGLDIIKSVRTGQQESLVINVHKLAFAFYHIIDDKTVDVLLYVWSMTETNISICT